MGNVALLREPRTRNRELTRERLLDAAREAFCAHGYENTSLRDIANSVGVNHALIKYYFDDKESLWRESVTQLFVEQHEFMRSAFLEANPKTDRDHMRTVIAAFVRFWSNRHISARMIYWTCMQDTEQMRWLADTHLAESRSYGTVDILRWQKGGLLSPDADPLFQYYAIMGAIFGPLVMTHEIKHSHGVDVLTPASIEKLVETILALLDRS
jgi:TetR/AcrR family transcriptional regulator